MLNMLFWKLKKLEPEQLRQLNIVGKSSAVHIVVILIVLCLMLFSSNSLKQTGAIARIYVSQRRLSNSDQVNKTNAQSASRNNKPKRSAKIPKKTPKKLAKETCIKKPKAVPLETIPKNEILSSKQKVKQMEPKEALPLKEEKKIATMPEEPKHASELKPKPEKKVVDAKAIEKPESKKQLKEVIEDKPKEAKQVKAMAEQPLKKEVTDKLVEQSLPIGKNIPITVLNTYQVAQESKDELTVWERKMQKEMNNQLQMPEGFEDRELLQITLYIDNQGKPVLTNQSGCTIPVIIAAAQKLLLSYKYPKEVWHSFRDFIF